MSIWFDEPELVGEHNHIWQPLDWMPGSWRCVYCGQVVEMSA